MSEKKPEKTEAIQIQGAGIHAAMLRVMDEVGAIAKDKRNKEQGFMFRGIEAAQKALQPAFIKHGVYLVPEVLEHKECEVQSKHGTHGWRVCLRVRFTFYALDGSSVVAVTDGEAIDYADKATNKAMSVALKYALFQSFMVPTEEAADDDTDNTSPDGRKRARDRASTRVHQSDDALDNVGKDNGEKPDNSITDAQRRAIFAKTKRLNFNDEDRARLLEKYGVKGTSDLTKKDASEILDMLVKQEKAHAD